MGITIAKKAKEQAPSVALQILPSSDTVAHVPPDTNCIVSPGSSPHHKLLQRITVLIRKLVACFTFCFCLGIAHAAITVGTCKSTKNTYPTISAAIAAAPANGVINVCPGTYPEQLIITKPLTINGLVIANQPGITITAPPTGVLPTPGTIQTFAQIFVNNAGGPVNLSNLSIVGSTLIPPDWYRKQYLRHHLRLPILWNR
jgi:hypothetical protein